jgi:Cu2+-containing amine oxidase
LPAPARRRLRARIIISQNQKKIDMQRQNKTTRCAEQLLWAMSFVFFTSVFPLLAAEAVHPLDPLSESEISSAVRILRSAPGFPPSARFSAVQLNEPPKAEVWNFRAGAPFRREAFAVVFDRQKNKTFEATVDLRAGRLLLWREIPGVQPLIFAEEYAKLSELVKRDARWQAAMRRRGISDFEKVSVDGWAVGEVDSRFTGRLMRALSYLKEDFANYYGRPVEGVVAIVNMNTHQVVDVTTRAWCPSRPPGRISTKRASGDCARNPNRSL